MYMSLEKLHDVEMYNLGVKRLSRTQINPFKPYTSPLHDHHFLN